MPSKRQRRTCRYTAELGLPGLRLGVMRHGLPQRMLRVASVPELVEALATFEVPLNDQDRPDTHDTDDTDDTHDTDDADHGTGYTDGSSGCEMGGAATPPPPPPPSSSSPLQFSTANEEQCSFCGVSGDDIQRAFACDHPLCPVCIVESATMCAICGNKRRPFSDSSQSSSYRSPDPVKTERLVGWGDAEQEEEEEQEAEQQASDQEMEDEDDDDSSYTE